jgi:hypothetical protein
MFYFWTNSMKTRKEKNGRKNDNKSVVSGRHRVLDLPDELDPDFGHVVAFQGVLNNGAGLNFMNTKSWSTGSFLKEV